MSDWTFPSAGRTDSAFYREQAEKVERQAMEISFEYERESTRWTGEPEPEAQGNPPPRPASAKKAA